VHAHNALMRCGGAADMLTAKADGAWMLPGRVYWVLLELFVDDIEREQRGTGDARLTLQGSSHHETQPPQPPQQCPCPTSQATPLCRRSSIRLTRSERAGRWSLNPSEPGLLLRQALSGS